LVRAVGREDVLHMLYALTAADVKAVGPDAYTPWKADLLEALYRRARRWFGGEAVGEREEAARRRRELWAARPTSDAEEKLALLPDEVAAGLALDDWAPMLDAWRQLPEESVASFGRYLSDRDAVRLTVLASARLAEGVFHKICGALAAHRLEVQAATIHTLADGGVLDVFDVRDVHHTGPTSPERLALVSRTVRRVLVGELAVEDALWSTRSSLFVARRRVIAADFVTVEIDNDSSPTSTVVDVFAPDRRGLLYTLASAIFRFGLSIHYAKIATYSDEVMDVFYVRTPTGEKLSDPARQEDLRTALIDAVRRLAEDPRSLGF
jgi:[protein-PII] uridylyltransferase